MMQECPVLKKAQALALGARIVTAIPDDYEPGDLWPNQALAELRHWCTNYDDLIHQLPTCKDCELDDSTEWDGECSQVEAAHNVIKWACKDLVEMAYYSPSKRAR